jgi:hypothetical protein
MFSAYSTPQARMFVSYTLAFCQRKRHQRSFKRMQSKNAEKIFFSSEKN